MNSRRLILCASLLAACLLSACSSTPATRFYTLNGPTLKPAENGSPMLALLQVDLPEMLERPQIVLRQQSHQVQVLEQQRWAEPLKAAVARVLTGHLQQHLPRWQVHQRQHLVQRQAKWELWLNIQRFDATPQQAAVLEASWGVKEREGKRHYQATTRLQSPVQSDDLPALLSAQEQTIQQLAQEIANKLQALELGQADSGRS